MTMPRRRHWWAGIATGMGLLLVAIGLNVVPTDASWRDSERAGARLSAGVVAPPTALTCTGSLLAGRVTFNWTAPAGGVARTGYSWSVTGAATGSGTLAATAVTTTQTLTLLTLGTATFTLRATGPGGWTSNPVSVNFLSVTGGIITC